MDNELLESVRDLVRDLADGRFAAIETDGRAGRLTAAELSSAVRVYGRTLLPLPEQAVQLIEVYPSDVEPRACSLDVPLWTVEEGRSDLTLSLMAIRDGDKYRLRISDLHVL
jgi:hypothetical protein